MTNIVSPEGEFEKIEYKDFHDATDGELASSKGDFNPFKDTLANSEAIPQTKKLVEQVKIQEDYVNEVVNKNDETTMTQKLAPHAKKNPADILSQSVKLPPTSSKEAEENAESGPYLP